MNTFTVGLDRQSSGLNPLFLGYISVAFQENQIDEWVCAEQAAMKCFPGEKLVIREGDAKEKMETCELF